MRPAIKLVTGIKLGPATSPLAPITDGGARRPQRGPAGDRENLTKPVFKTADAGMPAIAGMSASFFGGDKISFVLV